MNRDDLLELIHYHNESNARIVHIMAHLTPEQLLRHDAFDHGSALQTLRHGIDMDWGWRQLCIGEETSTKLLSELVPMNDFAETRAAWETESHELLRYVEGLDDAALQQEIVITPETLYAAPRWKILAHMVIHGTGHRSELAHYCTVCGHSPGDFDFI